MFKKSDSKEQLFAIKLMKNFLIFIAFTLTQTLGGLVHFVPKASGFRDPKTQGVSGFQLFDCLICSKNHSGFPPPAVLRASLPSF